MQLLILNSLPFILIILIGLVVGSFINVIVYRLPIMMNRGWRADCLAYLELDEDPRKEGDSFNLSLPRSHCPSCKAPIKFYQNIPVLSYLLLKGGCASCSTPISMRYPLIEAFTGIASGVVAWHFGDTPQALFAVGLTWALITLCFIDIDHKLLPDSITLPLLWVGLLLSLFGYFTDMQSSIIGAAAGYMIFWLVYQLCKLLTGKEGMGYGDFKLLALLGAWLGWQYLPAIILMSSLIGAVIGIAMIVLAKKDRNEAIPFGPYLAGAGWVVLLWGQDINQIYFSLAGM